MTDKTSSAISDAGAGIEIGSQSIQLGIAAVQKSLGLAFTACAIAATPFVWALTSEAERSLWLSRQLDRANIDLYGMVSDSALIDGKVVDLGAWLGNPANYSQAMDMVGAVNTVLLVLAIPVLIGTLVLGFVIHACAAFLGQYYRSDRVLQGVQDVIQDVDAFNQESRRLARGVELKPTTFGRWLTQLFA